VKRMALAFQRLLLIGKLAGGAGAKKKV